MTLLQAKNYSRNNISVWIQSEKNRAGHVNSLKAAKGKWLQRAVMVLIFCLMKPALAIVTIEDNRIKEPEPGFTGQFALAIAGQSGNTDKTATSVGTRLQWHESPVTNFIVFNHDSGETSGIRDTNKSFLHARHVRNITDRRAWEAFGQAEKNEFTRLSFRGLLGGNLRQIVYKSKDDRLAFVTGIGGFYSREELDARTGATDSGVDTLLRGNVYVIVKYRLNETVRLGSVTYYQPATSDFQDFLALEQASLQVKLTDRLDLTLSLEITHDSRPPQFIDETDVIYRSGIEYQF